MRIFTLTLSILGFAFAILRTTNSANYTSETSLFKYSNISNSKTSFGRLGLGLGDAVIVFPEDSEDGGDRDGDDEQSPEISNGGNASANANANVSSFENVTSIVELEVDINANANETTSSSNTHIAPTNLPIHLRIRKCCPRGQKLTRGQAEGQRSDRDGWKCRDSGDEDEAVYESDDKDERLKVLKLEIFKQPWDHSALNVTSIIETELDFGFPTSSSSSSCNLISLVNGEEIWFRVLETGEIVVGLHFWMWPIWLPVSDDEYCIDDLDLDSPLSLSLVSTNANTNATTTNESFPNTQVHVQVQGLLVFSPQGLQGYDIYKLHRTVYCTVFLISSGFLLLTLVIYTVAQGRSNFHAQLQISYFLAIFLFFLTEGLRILLKLDGLNIQLGPFCFFHAVLAQYFASTVSATITVLGFHMLWTFWKMRPIKSTQGTKRMKFFLCIVLPWVIPFLLLGAGLVYNHLTNPDAERQEQGIFKYGHYRCSSPVWLVGTLMQSCLFILNLLYFLLTTYAVLKTVHASKFAKQESQTKFASDAFHLLVKISLVMGIMTLPTIFELLFGQPNPLALYWVFNRIVFLGLLGVWLFIAFGCTRKHRDLLAKNSCLQWMARGTSTAASTSHTSRRSTHTNTSQSQRNISISSTRSRHNTFSKN